MLSLRFDYPAILLVGLLAIPLIVLGWRAMALTDSLRRAVALMLRTGLLLILTIALAGPHMQREHHHLTVIGLLDISGSVQRFADLPALEDIFAPPRPTATQSASEETIQSSSAAMRRSNIEYLRQWFRQATKMKEPDDRFGLVIFDGQAIALSAPTRGDYVDDNIDMSITQGTNIADAVRLGMAMFPADTAKRLVLVTDGNETSGDVLEAVTHLQSSSGQKLETAELASASSDRSDRGAARLQHVDVSTVIPIDVLPIAYHVTGDVQVARVEAPPTAQPGQTVTVRIILESAKRTAGGEGAQPAGTPGTLSLRREGLPVDLNGEQPGVARHLIVPAGQSVHLTQVTLGETPINRFEATFEADNPVDDALPDNDRAEAFTATPSRGSVLVLDPEAGMRENSLSHILNAAELPTQAQLPAQLPNDLLSLQNFDLIVLDNVSAAELSTAQQQLLSKYVNDLGGGLMMTGGENSFGAGGWNGTILETLLPLELDPAKQLQLPTAALVLVLDKSGSMNQPVAGARATQQHVANEGAALAIESLREDNLVGVVTFDMAAHTLIPLQSNEKSKSLAEIVRSIKADGGTNLEPGLVMAFEMLKDAKVAKKRVVCMSDGRSHTTDNLDVIAKQMADAGIQVSAIAVGDDADHETMQKIAAIGQGEFYSVRDPRRLPRVLIDSVQVMNKPLLKEAPFVPRVLATGSTLTAGMQSAPELGGLVITSARNDPKVALEMIHPDGEPLLAHWQSGLGRVAAFTSQTPSAASVAWSHKWINWPTAATFWTQLARTIARPAMNQNAELLTNIQDDRLHIALEMTSTSEGESLDYLQVDGTVYQPDGTALPVRLRQAAPGRYEATVDAKQSGNYVVALNPREGSRRLAPVIGGVNQSASPEFRRYSSNLGLLEEIVNATGGRRLNVADPKAVSLFDRTGMPPSMSSLPIWRIIVLWSLALVLLDVACRRLAWDANLLRRAWRNAAARVRPAHIRATEVAATLAILRRVSDEVEVRRETQTAGLSQFKPTGRIAPPPNRTSSFNEDAAVQSSSTHTRHHQERSPDATAVAAALDALLGRRPSNNPDVASAEDKKLDDNLSAAAETTNHLLAAKRRARQQIQGDADSQSP